MNVHTRYELAQLQSLDLKSKIMMTKARIKKFHEYTDSMCYVSFSGGKDSTVLRHIVESMYDDVPSVFVDTGLEYPEIRRFAKAQNNVTVIHPDMNFKNVIEKYGYPVISKEVASYVDEIRNTKSEKLRNIRLYGKLAGRYKIPEKWKFLIDAPFRISAKCCNVMKKHPCKKYENKTKRVPIIGTTCEESLLRLNSWIRNGCNSFDGAKSKSRPLSFWTEQDILQYIVENDLKIADIYGDIKQDDKGKFYTTGESRTGCMFCMFGCQFEHENKFQRMERTHPKLHRYCIEKLGIGKVLDYLNIPFTMDAKNKE